MVVWLETISRKRVKLRVPVPLQRRGIRTLKRMGVYMYIYIYIYTWCVQVLRSPKEAFTAAMQSWRERCEKCVCLQGDYVEK